MKLTLLLSKLPGLATLKKSVALEVGKDKKPPKEFKIFDMGEVETSKGTFTFDDEAAASVMAAYKDQGNQLCMDYEHQMAQPGATGPMPAACFFDLDLRADGLYAINCEWAGPAATMIAEGEYRYFSPWLEFDGNTGRVLRLVNMALTNMPATKGMNPLVAASSRATRDLRSEPYRVALSGLLTFEQIRDALMRAVQVSMPDTYAYVCDIYDDSVIVEIRGKLFKIGYKLQGAKAVLGDDAQEVVRTYVSAADGGGMNSAGMKLADGMHACSGATCMDPSHKEIEGLKAPSMHACIGAACKHASHDEEMADERGPVPTELEGGMHACSGATCSHPSHEHGGDETDSPDVQMVTFGVIPFKKGEIHEGDWDADAAETSLRKWASSDGSGDKDKVNFKKYAQGFAYSENEGKHFGDFKLPHHQVLDGKLVVSKRGVQAAAGVMHGARGGASIPAADEAAVKSHLAKHYAQWGEKAPWQTESKESETMGLSKSFIKQLGLSENASESEIEVAILRKLEKEAATTAQLVTLSGGKDTADAVAKLEAQKLESAQLRAKVFESETARIKTEVNALVTLGLSEGKIPPAQKDYWIGVGEKDVALLKGFLASAAPMASNRPAVQPTTTPTGEIELTPLERQVCLSSGQKETDWIAYKQNKAREAELAASQGKRTGRPHEAVTLSMQLSDKPRESTASNVVRIRTPLSQKERGTVDQEGAALGPVYTDRG